jgi:hypothetical protein
VEKLFLIFVVLIFGFIIQVTMFQQSTDSKRGSYISQYIFLILFSGLRSWNVGLNYDTEQYNSIFETVKATTWNEIIDNVVHNSGKDPFYGLFQKVFQVFTGSYQLYLLLVAVIIFSSFAGFIYKNTSQIRSGGGGGGGEGGGWGIFSYLQWLFLWGFNSLTGGTRGFSCLFFELWSFEYVKNKKYSPFLILRLVILFHPQHWYFYSQSTFLSII